MRDPRRLLVLLLFAIGALSCGGDGTNENAVPRISFSTSTVFFSGIVGGGNPGAIPVDISNSGTGTLSGLSVGTIGYGNGQPATWLNASLNTTTAPAVLTLTATLGALPEGTYNATVPVSSSASGVANSPQNVTVTFHVTP